MTKHNKPERLAKLLKHWDRATPEDRARFLRRIAIDLPGGADDGTRPALPLHSLAEKGRYLSTGTKGRVEAVMRRRSITPQAIMGEMGFSPQDISLALALARGSSLRLKVINALEGWLRDQEDRSS